MSRAVERIGAAGALLLLTATATVVDCQKVPNQRAGATRIREETRAGLRYRLSSSLSPRRSTLGDPATWTLTADLPASVRPGKLLRRAAAPELDLRAPKEAQSEREGKRTAWTWSYEIRGFTMGRISLPAVYLPVGHAAHRDTLFFPPDTLAVDSLTPAATGVVLPDRGAIPPALRPVDYAVIALVALVTALLIGLWMRARRRRRKTLEAPVPVEPPDVLLRRQIALLRADGEGLPRDQFYERLSLAIRDYAASVTRITTRDRTTSEIVRELTARGDVSKEGLDALRRALVRSDLAKFARSGGGWDEALEVLDIADRLPDRLASADSASAAGPSASAPKDGAGVARKRREKARAPTSAGRRS